MHQPWDRLHAAADAYAAMRWRLKIGVFMLSCSFTLFGLAVWMLAEFRMMPDVRYRNEIKTAAAAVSVATIPVSGFAVVPTDEPGIRWLATFLSRISLFLSFVFAIISAQTSRSGALTLVRLSFLTLYMALSAIGIIYYVRWADTRLLPPRAALAKVWAVGHSSGRTLTAVWSVYGIARAKLDPQFNWRTLLVLALAPQLYTVLTYRSHSPLRALCTPLRLCTPLLCTDCL